MNRARVLVIDDDPLFRSLITSILQRDFVVSVAAEGSEGYYQALENPPQLAIIDVRMPGWDGLRTLKAMREHQTLAKIPVMMLTSDASRQTVVAATEGGANDYVIKTALTGDELLYKARCLVMRGADCVNPPEGDGASQPSAATEGHAGRAPAARTPGDGGSTAHVSREAAALQALIDDWE
ncbi:MAG: response regulator [Deltaproteobacteria bacterium]